MEDIGTNGFGTNPGQNHSGAGYHGLNDHKTNGNGTLELTIQDETNLELRETGVVELPAEEVSEKAPAPQKKKHGNGHYRVRLHTVEDARRLIARVAGEIHQGKITVEAGRALVYTAREFIKAVVAEELVKRTPAIDLTAKDIAHAEYERREKIREEFVRLIEINGYLPKH